MFPINQSSLTPGHYRAQKQWDVHPTGLGAVPVTKAIWPGAGSPTGHPILTMTTARWPQCGTLTLPGAEGPGKQQSLVFQPFVCPDDLSRVGSTW